MINKMLELVDMRLFFSAMRMMLCFLLLAEPGAVSQNSTIDEKMFLARSLVEELHNPTILYARASRPSSILHNPTNMVVPSNFCFICYVPLYSWW